jgi:two-component system response regulator
MEHQLPIVLVEDNEDDVDLTLRALRRNHISNEVRIARDGVEALELLLGEDAVVPALVLLDLKLPKVHGLEVLERLRADDRTRLRPIVILTSSREDEDLIRGYTLGANSYIRKPVEFDRFSEAVREVGLYWLLLNEPPPAPRHAVA